MAASTAAAPRGRAAAASRVGVVVVALVVLVALAAWCSCRSLFIPSSRLVGWQLAGQVPGVSVWTGTYWRGGRGSDLATAQTTTVIPISMDEWPAGGCGTTGDSWLASPKVTYTPGSVTITMHMSDAFDAARCIGWYDYWGQPVEVHLTEPLGGRLLFDGSQIPPAPRPYP